MVYCRQFRRARRDGPLRYIIPSAEDQPPPYPANFGPAGEGGAGNNATAIHQNLNMTVEDGLEVSADQDQSAGTPTFSIWPDISACNDIKFDL